jgi:hypothetical protein
MNWLLRTRASRGATVAALAGFVTAVVIAATPAVASADTTITVRYRYTAAPPSRPPTRPSPSALAR